MAMYHRVGFAAAQSAQLWERWKKGEGLKSIGRASSSTNGPGKRWTSSRQQSDLANVLRRPREITVKSRHRVALG